MAVFVPKLKQSGKLDHLHFTVCNVGSRKISEQDDYGNSGWSLLVPQLTIYGFDADADACEAANADLEMRQINWTEKHMPLALGNVQDSATVYVTKHPMCSSLFSPNEAYAARFAGLSEVMDVDFTIEFEITTLDAFCQQENIQEIDFLQVDVQGADLQVLEGAKDKLNQSILAIQTEVEFSQLYQNQPLFADVDAFLRQCGFTLFDLAAAYRVRRRSPIRANRHPGQLLWGDAFYLRDLLASEQDQKWKMPDTILKLACVADVLDFPDYALELLEFLTLEYGTDPNYNVADSIVESLAEFPELVEQGLHSLEIVTNLQSFLSEQTAALVSGA
jgi:FkbM family methyltransferase